LFILLVLLFLFKLYPSVLFFFLVLQSLLGSLSLTSRKRFGSHNHKYGFFLILMRLYIFIPCSLKFSKQKSLFQVSPLSFDLMIVFWGSFGAVWKLVCKVLAW
jgi:hypothetical protein